jgi:hypothetical protein
MTVQSRVIFTRFADTDNPELRPWLAHVTRVLGKRAPVVKRMADPTVWQLVSANNRELARSASVFPGFRAASESAKATIEALPKAVIRPVVDESRGLHGWYLAINDQPAVICSRWYYADRERSQAVNLAVASLAVAVRSEGARAAIDRSAKENDLRVL